VPHERDERWVYVVIALLVVAYVAYRFHAQSAMEVPRVRVDWKVLGKVGSVLPYLAAVVFGVIAQYFARRRHESQRMEWESRLATEGLVRAEDGVRMWLVDARGRRRQNFEGQLKLTRSAFYVFETSGRREPLRFSLRHDEAGSPRVDDVSIMSRGGEYAVRLSFTSGGGASLDFASPDAQAWWIDIRKALGKTTDVEAAIRAAEGSGGRVTEPEAEWKDALTWRDSGR
jgi:hypothetical protein